MYLCNQIYSRDGALKIGLTAFLYENEKFANQSLLALFLIRRVKNIQSIVNSFIHNNFDSRPRQENS